MIAEDYNHDFGVFQVVMLDAMLPSFVTWLDSVGLELFLMPHDIDDLPTYGIAPKDF